LLYGKDELKIWKQEGEYLHTKELRKPCNWGSGFLTTGNSCQPQQWLLWKVEVSDHKAVKLPE
jgi:hypothetical protein